MRTRFEVQPRDRRDSKPATVIEREDEVPRYLMREVSISQGEVKVSPLRREEELFLG